MRIISGDFRGRKLIPPEGYDIRPTADRVREAVFNILGPNVRHKNVLDLFAGTGAMGLEALSRGADRAVFADRSCDLIQQNIAHCRVVEKAEILECDLSGENPAATIGRQQFDLIFIDPPYRMHLVDTILGSPWFHQLLAAECTIVAEQFHTETIKFLPHFLDIYRQKKYSKTVISFISRK